MRCRGLQSSLFYFIFLLFRATPGAYGGSQARGLIRARATAMQDPRCICDLHHSSWQRQIAHSLSEDRDQTCNLMVPSWSRFCCTIMGTPQSSLKYCFNFEEL